MSTLREKMKSSTSKPVQTNTVLPPHGATATGGFGQTSVIRIEPR